MEVTAMNSGSVHVLRHSFEPSEHLAKALDKYLKPGVPHPRSLLYATRLVTLNTDHYPAHEISIDYDMVNRAFVNRHHERVLFGRQTPKLNGEKSHTTIATKSIGNGTMRIALMPADYSAFSSLLTGFDDLPNDLRMPDGRAVHYYVHADLPERSLLDNEKFEANTQNIAAELDVVERARMYYVTPSAVERRVIPLPTQRPSAAESK